MQAVFSTEDGYSGTSLPVAVPIWRHFSNFLKEIPIANKRLKTALVWLGLVAVFFVLFIVGQNDDPGYRESFEIFVQHVEEDRVVSIRVHNNEIMVQLGDGQPSYTTLGVVNDEITQLVSDHGGMITWGEPPRHTRTILVLLLPLGIIILFIWYFAKKANVTQTGIFSLSKSRAREVTDDRNVSFAEGAFLICRRDDSKLDFKLA